MRIFGGHDGGSGCAYYRVHLALAEMAKHGYEVTMADAGDDGHPPSITLDMLRGHDVVVAQRWNKHDGLCVWRGASLWAKTCYELDDDLWHLTPENFRAYQLYSRPDIQDAIQHAAATADLVTVSTEPLKAVVREVAGHDRIAVLPNCIPRWATMLPYTLRRRPRIGWGGGASHGVDIGQVASPLRRFLKRFGDWDLQLNGSDYRATIRAPAVRMFYVPWTPVYEHPEKYFTAIDYDIGLAPLYPTAFARSKSGLKVLEHGARCIPTIATDIEPYRDIITHGVDGFLVKREHEWLHYMSVLASDDALREKMGIAAQDMARRHLIETHWTRWRDAYEGLFRHGG